MNTTMFYLLVCTRTSASQHVIPAAYQNANSGLDQPPTRTLNLVELIRFPAGRKRLIHGCHHAVCCHDPTSWCRLFFFIFQVDTCCNYLQKYLEQLCQYHNLVNKHRSLIVHYKSYSVLYPLASCVLDRCTPRSAGLNHA